MQFLERKDIDKIVKVFGTSKPLDLRDAALFEVLFSTGMRISEALALPDAPFSGNKEKGTLELSIVGKGDYRRTVYFSPRTLKSVRAWLDVREDRGTKLFPMTVRMAQYVVKRRASDAGYEGVHPHMLRHSFGTYILGKTGNIRLCQELLGHRAISSTMLYTHVTSKELKEAHGSLFK